MEKPSLPINLVEKQKFSIGVKTKIAAWLMIVSGIIGILDVGVRYITPGLGGIPFSIGWALSTAFRIAASTGFLGFFPLRFFIVMLTYYIGAFFIAPVFLLRRKKWAWQFIIICLFIGAIAIFVDIWQFPRGEKFSIFYPIILFLLFFLDRKNFWKIAS